MGPDPNEKFPIAGYDKLAFLKNFITKPNIIVGDYTYYDDPREGPEKFEELNVLYNHKPDIKLIIGKFCAIAAETRFLMAGDHKLDAVSTYPFPVFQNGWEGAYDPLSLPSRGDLVVGHDVWFGYRSLVRSGVTIGNGAIIASGAVVVKDVPAYSIIGGNPGKVVKMRFDEKTIERLQKIAWWDWDIKEITKHLPLITALDIDRLEEASQSLSSV